MTLKCKRCEISFQDESPYLSWFTCALCLHELFPKLHPAVPGHYSRHDLNTSQNL